MEKTETERLTEQIRLDFLNSRHVLKAVGQETRQSILLALMTADGKGLRIGELMKRTHLSRPSLYEHLKILMESALITVHHEGTKNYYAGCFGNAWDDLEKMLCHIKELKSIPPPQIE